MADNCTACGSTPEDREKYRKGSADESIPAHLLSCPHCGSTKCCMCDMGDDVRCMNCEGQDDD